MGLSAQGMKFYFSTATGVSTTSGLIDGVKSWNLTRPTYSQIDDTDLSDVMEVSKPGIMKKSQMTIEGNYLLSDTGQNALAGAAQSTVLCSIMICFSDTAKSAMKYDCNVSEWSQSGGVNELMKFNLTLDLQTTGTSTTYA